VTTQLQFIIVIIIIIIIIIIVRGREGRRTKQTYRYAPHNDVSVNDGPHI